MYAKTSTWKYVVMVALVILALVYAVPNIFGQDPSIQISPTDNAKINQAVINKVTQVLQQEKLQYKSIKTQPNNILIRFDKKNTQNKAKSVIKATLGDSYTVALNMATRTPAFLLDLGAKPMTYGLDLRGGIYFLLAVDVKDVIARRIESDMRSMANGLRRANIRYSSINKLKNNTIRIGFRDSATLNTGMSYLERNFADMNFAKLERTGIYTITAQLTPAAITKIREYTMSKTITTLRNRVDELGVSEPEIQIQGLDRIAVSLPGVQDAAEASQILGGTATVEFHMVDTTHDAASAAAGAVPYGSLLFKYQDAPVLLKSRVILSGNSITYAASGIGEDGRPNVSIRISGDAVPLFSRITGENIGKPMGTVFKEVKTTPTMVKGKVVFVQHKIEKVINVATIQNRLFNSFQITGLDSPRSARNLALLLRAGSLPATIYPVEERIVGPTLGKQNIHNGILAAVVGFLLVVIFMAVYYGVLGIIADIALFLNLIFIIAILSLLGATLSLGSIAGIVLTVGMAVDANVLIFERIREELRKGMTPLAAIQAGYDRAFVTIVDANVTTLIVVVILIGLGSGIVKGFAVTTTIGLVTSMVTAINFTRAIVHWLYGRKPVKKISIGIKTPTAITQKKSQKS